MLKRLKRINILVPKKEETRQALTNIHKTLVDTFGGYTEKEVFLVHHPAWGKWEHPQNGKIILDRHTCIICDVQVGSVTRIYDRIIDITHKLEKQFNESELYVTVENICRIV